MESPYPKINGSLRSETIRSLQRQDVQKMARVRQKPDWVEWKVQVKTEGQRPRFGAEGLRAGIGHMEDLTTETNDLR